MRRLVKVQWGGEHGVQNRGARRAIAALSVALVGAGCAASAPQTPDLAALYEEAAATGADQRNPLVVTPGTLGSQLIYKPTGELVWGGEGFSVDPDTPEGFAKLALPIGDGKQPLAALQDEVSAGGLLETAKVSFLGAVIEEGVYDGIVSTLRIGGYSATSPLRVLDTLEGRLERTVATPGTLAIVSGAAGSATLTGGVGSKTVGVEGPVVISADAPAEGMPPGSADVTAQNGVVFAYDWRRDLSETAADLYRTLSARREALLARGLGPDDKPLKFDLIAHSMGGLAIRYFLMYGDAPLPMSGPLPPITWKGAELVEKVVIVGTPHGGSVTAFENLVNGKAFSPLTPEFPAPLIGSHPSVYQLMPRDRHARAWWNGDPERPLKTLYDAELWDRYNWGLLSPEADDAFAPLLPQGLTVEGRRMRLKAHLAHLLRRAFWFHRAIDRPTDPPLGLDIFLVVGGGFETPAAVAVDEESGEVVISAREEGDGVVLRSSVLLDERVGAQFEPGLRSPLRFRATLLLPDEHVELTKSKVFGDNLLFWLLEEPRRAPRGPLSRPRLAASGLGAPNPVTVGAYDGLAREYER
ncbi:MAG: hypothetical protein KTR21_02695 [Rhodobacteraceae bacterium]|nr:hypothetical protein [Paracoccaceae bacterium]